MNFKQEQEFRMAHAMMAQFIIEIVGLIKDPEAKNLYDEVQAIYKKRRKEWTEMVILSTYIDKNGFDVFKYTKVPKPSDEVVIQDIIKIGMAYKAGIPKSMTKPVDKKVKKRNSGIIS